MGCGLAHGFESIVPTLKKVIFMNNELFGGKFFELTNSLFFSKKSNKWNSYF
jgi:hypothetical protein